MPKKININGAIIPNDSAWLYDLFEVEYTSPSKLANALDSINGEDVTFNINSPGGSVFAGYEMYNMIKAYSGKTLARISFAASAASFIAMATDEAEIGQVGNIMIHRASTGTQGNKNTHNESVAFLETIDNTIANAYMHKTGKARDEIVDLMDKETWFTPEQALELGLVDRIADAKTGFMPNIYNSFNCGNEAVEKLLAYGNAENLKKAIDEGKVDTYGINSVLSTVQNNTNIPKEEEEMTLDKLKNEYPDLYNQIVQDAQKEAVTNERERIKEIQNLSVPGVEDAINDGIENGLSAGEVAMNIIKAQKEKGANYLKDAKEDAQPLNQVDNTVPSNKQSEEEKDNEAAKNMADIMNGGIK